MGKRLLGHKPLPEYPRNRLQCSCHKRTCQENQSKDKEPKPQKLVVFPARVCSTQRLFGRLKPLSALCLSVRSGQRVRKRAVSVSNDGREKASLKTSLRRLTPVCRINRPRKTPSAITQSGRSGTKSSFVYGLYVAQDDYRKLTASRRISFSTRLTTVSGLICTLAMGRIETPKTLQERRNSRTCEKGRRIKYETLRRQILGQEKQGNDLRCRYCAYSTTDNQTRGRRLEELQGEFVPMICTGVPSADKKADLGG